LKDCTHGLCFSHFWVLPLVIPPLRIRGDDITALAEHWLSRLGLLNKKSFVLQALDWSPFNMDPKRSAGLGSLSMLGKDVTLAELEKKHIEMLLDKHNNVSDVAKILGVDRRTLQRKTNQWKPKSSR
jgi:transcriptional regulator with PAS, ATPase and Fis domain